MDYQHIHYGLAYNIHGKFKADGTAPLCIVARQGKHRVHYSTGIDILPSEWDTKRRLIVNHIYADTYNIQIKEKILRLQQIEIQLWKENIMPTVYLQKCKYKDDSICVSRDKFGNVIIQKKHDLCDFVIKNIIHDSSRKTNTKSGYRSFLSVIEDFAGRVNIEDIDYDFVCNFDYYLRKKRKNISSTIRHAHNKLKAILNEAILHDFIGETPYKKFKIARDDREREPLNIETVIKLEKYEKNTGDLFAAQFLFAIYTGLRYSDQIKLKDNNIKTVFRGKHQHTILTISTQKTNKPIKLPLDLLFGGRALDLLKKYSISSIARLASCSTVNRKLKALMKSLKISDGENITWHIARHTTATWLTKLSVPVTTIQKLLGHKKINTTLIYAQTNDEIIREELQKSIKRMKVYV